MHSIARRCFILAIALLLALTLSVVPVAHALSPPNDISKMLSVAGLGWPMTTQTGFEEGVVASEADTSTSPGDVLLSTMSPWYNADWGYKRPITITNSSGGALTDYQVRVTVNTQELIPAKMQDDGDDIRFTQSDGQTEIAYWIESGINTTSTLIWVRVPSIPTGDSTIYLYYGNSGATAASSVSNTFPAGSFTDSFTDETKISSSTNVDVLGDLGEVNLSSPNQTIAFRDSFDLWKWYGSQGGTNWWQHQNIYHDGTYSVFAENGREGYLTSDEIDLSGATSADLDFWYRKNMWEGTGGTTDFTLYFYDGSSWNLITELDSGGLANNVWAHYDHVAIDLGTYGVSNFRIRFDATLIWPEGTWVDQLTLTADTQTVFWDSFDLTQWDGNGATNWYLDGVLPNEDLETDRFHDGKTSVRADDNNEGYLTSDDIDLSSATSADLDFWFNKRNTDIGEDFLLYFYDGTQYNLIDDLDDNGADNTWLHYDRVPIDLGTYGISNFRIRFYASLEYPLFSPERVWVDQLTLTQQLAPYVSPGDVTSVTIPTDTGTRLAVGNQLSWTDDETAAGTDINYQVYYLDGTWQLIPDADLPGNSTGFDTSPVDLSSLQIDYEQIRVEADLSTSDTAVTPRLKDWTVTYYYRKYTSPEPTAGAPGAEELLDYNTSGTIASKVFDTGTAGTTWLSLSWLETLPASTDITFEVRASDTSFLKDAATPSWTSVGGTSPVTAGLPSGRYQQWRATLTTSVVATPVLEDVRVLYL